jgi:hypothetical protein
MRTGRVTNAALNLLNDAQPQGAHVLVLRAGLLLGLWQVRGKDLATSCPSLQAVCLLARRCLPCPGAFVNALGMALMYVLFLVRPHEHDAFIKLLSTMCLRHSALAEQVINTTVTRSLDMFHVGPSSVCPWGSPL